MIDKNKKGITKNFRIDKKEINFKDSAFDLVIYRISLAETLPNSKHKRIKKETRQMTNTEKEHEIYDNICVLFFKY